MSDIRMVNQAEKLVSEICRLEQSIMEQEAICRDFYNLSKQNRLDKNYNVLFWRNAAGCAIKSHVHELRRNVIDNKMLLRDLVLYKKDANFTTASNAMKLLLMVDPMDSENIELARQVGWAGTVWVTYGSHFGLGLLKAPHAVSFFHDRIFVADNADALYIFSLTGEYIGQVRDIESPADIWPDDSGLWVCDWASQRIHYKDELGVTQKVIKVHCLNDELGRDRPECAVPWNGGFAMIFSDESRTKSRVAFIDGTTGQERPLSCPDFKQYNNLTLLDGELALCGLFPSILAVGVGKPRVQTHFPILIDGLPIRCCGCGHGGYITSGKYLFHFNNTFSPVFWLDVEPLNVQGSSLLFGVHSTIRQGVEIVYATDRIKKCVHVFNIHRD